MDREKLTTIVTLLVAGVWAVVTLASLVVREYTVLGAITPVMLIVAGFLFGIRGGNGKQ